MRADRAPDWTILTTRGRGRFVGTHLHVWNPRGGWWGEGDEKFFVDGERFPSIFGTGSEDYFGYAWSSDARFSRPYHGQLLNEKNRGNVDDNRWHIPDSVPFQTGFDGYIEKYFSNTRPDPVRGGRLLVSCARSHGPLRAGARFRAGRLREKRGAAPCDHDGWSRRALRPQFETACSWDRSGPSCQAFLASARDVGVSAILTRISRTFRSRM